MRVWLRASRPDPEWVAIEKLLTEVGETIADSWEEAEAAGGVIYAIERTDWPAWAVDSPRVVRIDHHAPGDPGYGRPPAKFLAASSVGQVIAELARLGLLPETWQRVTFEEIAFEKRCGEITWRSPLRYDVPGWYVVTRSNSGYRYIPESEDERRPARSYRAGPPVSHSVRIPDDIVLTAAADHCLAAAYRKECPGVYPDKLMRWRAETRAAFQGRTVEDVLADVEQARERLRTAPRVRIGDTVTDIREEFVPELPEAAMREGIAYLATVTEPTGRRKVVLGGHTTPEIMAAWPAWAAQEGLVDLYGGDPAHGFAGGYLPETNPAGR